MLGRNWVSQYIVIHAPIKRQTDQQLELEPCSIYTESRKYVRRKYSNRTVKKDPSCHRETNEDSEEVSASTALLDTVAETETCDNPLRRRPVLAILRKTRGEVSKDQGLEDTCTTVISDSPADKEDSSEFETDHYSNRRSTGRKRFSGCNVNYSTPVEDLGPPGPTELIRYLWNMDTKYTRQAYGFILNFLIDRKVRMHETEAEKRNTDVAHRRE